jgi:hypothetical protein
MTDKATQVDLFGAAASSRTVVISALGVAAVAQLG